jgi:hypothetical protein
MHPASGLLLFVLVIGALVWIAGRDALRAQPGNARPPVSDRFAIPIFTLCALALVPVVVHSYLHLQRDECANPQALVPEMSAGSFSPERDAEIRNNIHVHQWREGRLPASGAAPELRFAVIRSYDPKQLYYRGTRRIWKDVQLGGDTVDWLESDDGRLPIVRSRVERADHRESDAVIEALLVYDGKPIENGLLAQLRAAPRQVLTGSRPMTIFAVRADVPVAQREAAEKRASQWLLDSWRTYRVLCGE